MDKNNQLDPEQISLEIQIHQNQNKISLDNLFREVEIKMNCSWFPKKCSYCRDISWDNYVIEVYDRLTDRKHYYYICFHCSKKHFDNNQLLIKILYLKSELPPEKTDIVKTKLLIENYQKQK